jgi:molybdenum cofactor synthesis domain-containing protein
MTTAAGILIGNELLTGKFRDENGEYLIKSLRARGISLGHLVMIPDSLDDIAREVRRCSENYDMVFTSGGVGPTHDDITLEGVARAFDVEVFLHPELVASIKEMGWPMNYSTRRMASVPQGTVLIRQEGWVYPILQTRNVYILPGVPRIFRFKLEKILEDCDGVPVCAARVFVTERESSIAERLAHIDQEHPEVDIGSYPRFGEKEFRVIVTLESADEGALGRAVAEVENTFETLERDVDAV